MWIVLIFILILTTILEAITTIPLVLIALLCLTVIFEKTWIFAVAFFMGLILDLFQLRGLGQTSLYFIIFLIVVLLYEKKFEIKTKPFVFLSTFAGAFFYLLFFGYDYVFIQALVSAVIEVLLFHFFSMFKMSS